MFASTITNPVFLHLSWLLSDWNKLTLATWEKQDLSKAVSYAYTIQLILIQLLLLFFLINVNYRSSFNVP